MSILEQIRLKHETIEAFENAIGMIMNEKPNGQKSKVEQQHRIKALVDGISATAGDLTRGYQDTDGLLRDELYSMKGNLMFKAFYENYNSIREYYMKYSNLESFTPAALANNVQPPNILWSGDEVFGKYLDLNEFFNQFINIPNIPIGDKDYLQYLDKFNSFFYINESVKYSKAFRLYIDGLWTYLSSFFLKIQPLVDLNELIEDWRKAFDEKWSVGKIPGWRLKESSSTERKAESQPLRLGMFNSPEELEVLGIDRLKEALEAIGLKCGGSLKERAQRLWSVRGKKAEDIPEKLKAKPSAGQKRKLGDIATGDDDPSDDKRKQIAWLEYKIISLCEIMMDIITSTRRHAEKQQSRTAEEKELELYEEEYGTVQDIQVDGQDDDDEDEPIYNPLHLPLGWDGKPIPYWLYKLHGLSSEFKCEICGNQTYYGRRNFDRHFQEARHVFGMRCLGIPNSKHFHDITLIEDALALYVKIKDQISTEQFMAELEEEFEDSEGNVLNRRTFEDLARQGLL